MEDVLGGIVSVIQFILEHKEALSSNKRKCLTLITVVEALKQSLSEGTGAPWLRSCMRRFARA